MKIRNIVFSGFMASILMAGGAYAATGNELTTKNYVDGAYQAAVVGADSALGVHAADTNLHVTTTEKSTWNAKQSALTSPQLEAVNSGITSEKVAAYEGYADTIAEKADSKDVYTKSETYTKSEVASQINTALTGISAEGISALDARLETAEGDIEALESGKVDKVTGSSLVADTKVSAYDAHLANDDIHVTSEDKTKWDGYATGKQDTLNTAQLAAVNSGITASKVSTYDGYANTIAEKANSADLGALAEKSTIVNADVADGAAIAQSKIAGLTDALGAKANAADLACDGDYCYINGEGKAVSFTTVDSWPDDGYGESSQSQ